MDDPRVTYEEAEAAVARMLHEWIEELLADGVTLADIILTSACVMLESDIVRYFAARQVVLRRVATSESIPEQRTVVASPGQRVTIGGGETITLSEDRGPLLLIETEQVRGGIALTVTHLRDTNQQNVADDLVCDAVS